MRATDAAIVIIPARMASVRLPGKPLAPIGGRAMVLHVRDRAVEAGFASVVVACDDPQIADIVRADGGSAVLTEPTLPSGSDRVHAACESLDPSGRFEIVINLQGDLPTIGPVDLASVLTPLVEPAFDIATLVAPITSDDEARSPSVVKAACSFENGEVVAPAPYFSRAAIPWGKGPLWHHVGVYAFRRAALRRFVSLPPSGLERREGLEQLRAIEAGMRIGCARIGAAPFGVDTPDDLERARRALAA